MHQSTRTQQAEDARLAELLTGVAIQASAAILAVDFRRANTRQKADASPVTIADEAAQAVVLQGLARVAPGVPVVSEEAVGEWREKEPPREFLLVDPLDGTAEFIAGRLEYTVNIALVRDGTPAVGVIAAPALGLIWRGAANHGAARLRFADGEAAASEIIRTRPWPAGECVATVSRSHFDPASAAFLARLGSIAAVESGSAIKFCRLAEGAAEVYPRLAQTSEWDVAAGHAVVVAAGGMLVAPDGTELRYGRARDGFRVPGFIAWGDPAAARRFMG
ncbi:MAG: 3'(2'),5'-bisphosphate nucleotidase CysQ [Alphaproteobacteria bacterium]|nr:MAG: 3'(2'),5'-bisphosphate nucleotidase CysQ [Alphaproteobacteria bacterium]